MKTLLVLIGLCCLQGAMCCAQTAEVSVDLSVDFSQAGKKISPHQFGVFLEEEDDTGKGEIDTALLRNGSFSKVPTLDAWSKVHAGTRQVLDIFGTEKPVNTVWPRSLRVEVTSPNGDRASVANEGYWGVAVHRGTGYPFVIDERTAAGFDGRVMFSRKGRSLFAFGWRPELTSFNTARCYATPSFLSPRMMDDSSLNNVVFVHKSVCYLTIKRDGRTSGQSVNVSTEVQSHKITGTAADYTSPARVRETSVKDGVVVHFAAQDDGGTFLSRYLSVCDFALAKICGGFGDLNLPVYQAVTSFFGPISRETSRWYDVAIHVTGRSVVCSLDGKDIHDDTVPETLGPLIPGAAGRLPTGSGIVRLVKISPLKQSVAIAFAVTGTNKYSRGTSILTSADVDVENSISDPTRIPSVARRFSVVGGNLRFEMEGNSFTVLMKSPVTI